MRAQAATRVESLERCACPADGTCTLSGWSGVVCSAYLPYRSSATGRVLIVEAGEIDSSLGLRLGAEALRTFLFFFLGFDTFAARLPRGGPSRV